MILSGSHSFGFHNNIFLRIQVVSFESNPQPGGPSLWINVLPVARWPNILQNLNDHNDILLNTQHFSSLSLPTKGITYLKDTFDNIQK
jgi:hypothetical protein